MENEVKPGPEISLADTYVAQDGSTANAPGNGGETGPLVGGSSEFGDLDSNREANFEAGTEAARASIREPWGLPAALCDDLLIQEIRSIPDKMGFKIGEVADLLGIKQYVLRYWESEFEVLKPKKAQNNQRYYTKRDVENAYLVRKLLHRDRFSIEGARSALKALRYQVKKEKDWNSLHQRIDGVLELCEDLKKNIAYLRSFIPKQDIDQNSVQV